ncbi:MAG: nucleotidyltransferase domain-containing protein [Verrucomicrobiales bacterium]|nr:nucleotidyltransferase domain-containing protein [Verrucomicrobiales bacterium]
MNDVNPLKLIEAERSAFKALGVVRIGLFGSILSPDRFSPSSDVDVFVEFDPKQKSFDTFFGVYELLRKMFQHEIDLVTDVSLSPYIGPKILEEVKYASLAS